MEELNPISALNFIFDPENVIVLDEKEEKPMQCGYIPETWTDLKTDSITVTDATAYGINYGLRGMRLSFTQKREHTFEEDIELAKKLIRSGSSHRKFLRLAQIWCDIRAPRYWWTQYDTYRIGTDGVSESTMHSIMSREITESDFAEYPFDDMGHFGWIHPVGGVIPILNDYRDEGLFREIIQALPQSYLQTRTVRISFETLRKMVEERSNHKLQEWHDFTDWIRRNDYYGLICEGL